ncbi:aminotransferase class V-fold PLP-dependent enzyme [Sporofaciens sp. SGI.106]|uniref:aminotransferase class V-fold PLP-dependent enzyme n=1 Tax=Sporofaciens sp. SGI.106 TaxID=3420568 RepID=UPI003D067989
MESKRRNIYFDNGSTSYPKAPGVADAVAHLLTHGAFNINRGNYEGAYEVAEMVLETREKLAALFGASDSRQVVFTPGITFSLNYFIKGLLKPGDHVLISGLEHNGVMRPLHQMEKCGITWEIVPTDMDGTVLPENVESCIRKETKAVIMLHASNVCGTILPIGEIGEICHRYGLYFAVDTAQSAGSIPVKMQEWHIDFLAFTGHKGLLGPQGIGGFLLSDRLNEVLVPVITGGTGSQSDSYDVPDTLPDKFESGTMNLPGIAGLHAALSYIEKVGMDKIHGKKMELTEYFLEQIGQFSDIRVVGKQGIHDRVAVVSLDFQGRDNAVVAFELEQNYGIMTRVGLHCAPLAHETLHSYPQGTVRFAFSASNTKEEIDVCIHAIREIDI